MKKFLQTFYGKTKMCLFIEQYRKNIKIQKKNESIYQKIEFIVDFTMNTFN